MFSTVPNFLSGILAIIIAITSMCGGLMTGGADKPFTVELGFEQLEGDPSSVGVAGQSPAVTSAVMKLIGLISFRLSASGTTGRLDVKLSGDPAASLAVRKQDGGWAVQYADRERRIAGLPHCRPGQYRSVIARRSGAGSILCLRTGTF